MNTFRALVLAMLSGMLCTAATAQPAAPAKSDATTTTIQLFNGKNFDGWDFVLEKPGDATTSATMVMSKDPAPIWSIKDGVIECAGKPRGYMRTEFGYGDYDLSVDWRWTAPGGNNSGLLLNLVDKDTIWPKGIELQMQTTHAGDIIYYFDASATENDHKANPRGVSTGHSPRPGASVEKPIGEWNTYRAVVKGDTITVYVNGTQVNKVTGVTPSSGKIGLQSEGWPLEFRNIKMTPLGKFLHFKLDEMSPVSN